MKSMRNAILAITVALPMAAWSAGESVSSGAFFAQLSAVAPAELPTTAADLVTHAAAKDLKQTTIAVVRAAVGLNPAAAPSIVGTIAQADPTMAPTAAATAAALVPKSVAVIVKAAAAAAPAQVEAIVAAVCRVAPADFRIVAEAVAKVVPGAERQILAGILAAMPCLQSVIQPVLASNGTLPSLKTVLMQSEVVVQTQAVQGLSGGNLSGPRTPLILASAPASPSGSPIPSGLPQAPSSGPPPVPIPTTGDPQVPVTGTEPVINPGDGTPADGGHDYTAP